MDDSQISERTHTEDMDQDEAKYSPEEKSFLDKSEVERTPTPSEESEEDEGTKLSVINGYFFHFKERGTIEMLLKCSDRYEAYYFSFLFNYRESLFYF